MKRLGMILGILLVPALALAEAGHAAAPADMTRTIYGYLGVIFFVAAYCLVPLENNIHLRKSKPVLAAAGIIWVLLAIAYIGAGDTHTAHQAIKYNLLEYAELFLFLLVAMTYINSMEERNVFQALRAWLVSRGFSMRSLFWITGLLAFFISPVADNMTTALLMGAVVMAVAGDNVKFVALACINIVIAANAGGAFSPFGDITTLMVWQKGRVEFIEFFDLFIPSAVNWLVPAAFMSLAIAKGHPKKLEEQVSMKYGAKVVMALFLLTIITAVCFHNFLHLPPAAGMMLGLAYLGLCAFHIKKHEGRSESYDGGILGFAGELRQPLRRLLERKRRSLNNIIDYFPEPAFAIDLNHVITHWNKALEDLTGIPAKDQVGTKNQWKPFYPSPRPSMADLILDRQPEEVISNLYKQCYRKNLYVDEAYDSSAFFPGIGESGKWVTFSALHLKDKAGNVIGAVEVLQDFTAHKSKVAHFDIMSRIAHAEWDTLLFFYGVILAVGGLAQFGYLAAVSAFMYTDLGPTMANTMVGLLSAIVDNIPVMFAVLTMSPEMSHGQWLLVTMTAGVGGSLLSIGSAAGVALMGAARGKYTFGAHLKWTPVIMLGYVASIFVHLWINAKLM
ncbi:MAG: PAS domain-containing protein [Desulfobacteraceae bacterium]|nr:MAG: PAS domain-containing protein [Desulfobacteraceae bacterium]